MNNGDPLAALEHLRTSEANIDAALAPLRSQRENAEKARTNAQAQISLAETAFERAERYVQGRRGAIDLSVRSTLHDSEQSLKAARAAISSDPAKASALASDARARRTASLRRLCPTQPTPGTPVIPADPPRPDPRSAPRLARPSCGRSSSPTQAPPPTTTGAGGTITTRGVPAPAGVARPAAHPILGGRRGPDASNILLCDVHYIE